MTTAYISDKMATMGIGATDTTEVQAICDAMSESERDVLDCWYNLGIEQKMRQEYQEVENNLRKQFSNDDLLVLSAYVNARRNQGEY